MRSANQSDRVNVLKKGEGTFVYLGGACDTHSTPGIPLLDKHGHQVRTTVFKTVENERGEKVQIVDPDSGEKGELVWKKAPKFERIPLATFKLRSPTVFAEHVGYGEKPGERVPSFEVKPSADGVTKALFLEFPKDKRVFVGDPRIAFKLRCLPFFMEVDGEAAEAPKAGVGRPRKEVKGEAAEG